MNPLVQSILRRHDANESVATIAAAESVSFGHVYTVLREHRPNRQRQPRTRTSERRKLILGLLAGGIAPPRVAFLAECTPTYVYKLAKEEGIVT
jgi:hypothetical protein